MMIFKAAAVAVVTAVITLIIKQIKQEYSALVQLSGITVIAILAFSLLMQTVSDADFLLNSGDENQTVIKLMLKTVSVAAVSGIAADICRDSGSTSVAGIIELLSKLVIISMAMPVIKTMASFALGLINK
ncbi:MAG: stage III sporulation AC/AD family protein [Clostridiales bacterium]|nr:stage III sporulation AC/AD family protein [Clostridiales bacterium]